MSPCSSVLAPARRRDPLRVALLAPLLAAALGDPGDGPLVPPIGPPPPLVGEVPPLDGPGGAVATEGSVGLPPMATWSLAFVADAPVLTADGGAVCTTPISALGRLDDTSIGWTIPRAGTSAVKALAGTEIAALLEDQQGDGEFWPPDWDEIDALGYKRASPPFARLHRGRLVLSTENGWAGADEWSDDDGHGALDGSLFLLHRSDDGGSYEVELFLPEQLVLRALGPGSDPDGGGVDIDAFTQDVIGNVFLSFRSTEWVNGTALEDEGVVCLPAARMLFNSNYDIVDVDDGCAVIVLDRERVDALVSNVGLLTPAGAAITGLGDLQALELDPAGGTFEPVQPVPSLEDGVPHLFFNGQKIGPTVLSTRNGGSLAVLDGVVLGRSPVDGTALGLDPVDSASTSADLAGLLVFPGTTPPICIDATAPELDLVAGGSPIEFVLGNATPGGVVLLLLGVEGAWPLDVVPSMPAPPAAVYPDLLVSASAYEEWITADGNGRLLWSLSVPSPGVPFRVVAQAFDLDRGELSAPAAVWCPFP